MRNPPSVLLLIASAAVLGVVPDWPHRHAGDPTYWAVLGYLLIAVLLVARTPDLRTGGAGRRMIRVFLVALPLVYVFSWFRNGGTSAAGLGLQLAGLAVWAGFAVKAARSDAALWLGCAVHVVWDAAHFGRSGYIPDWYVTACVAADLGIAAWVLMRLIPAPFGTSAGTLP